MKKYQLTGIKINHRDITLSRIEALESFTTVCGHKVNAGDLGGWIETELNLSQDGRAWVSDEAKVFDDARVSDNAWVFGNAEVYDEAKVFYYARVYDNAKVGDKAWVYGSAVVCDDAEVYGNTDVCGDSWVSGNVKLCGDTKLCGDADVFSLSHVLNVTSIGEDGNSCTFFRTKAKGIGVAFKYEYHSLEAFLTLISGWDSEYKAPAEAIVKDVEAHIELTTTGGLEIRHKEAITKFIANWLPVGR